MTNEELVQLIKYGHPEYIPELWNNINKLMYKLAAMQYRLQSELYARTGITLDDLQNEGYFAMLGAVRAFDAAKGYAFTSYLGLQLKCRINALTKQNDVLNREDTASLDMPLDTEDEESGSLCDLIADPQSGADIADFEERDSYTLLHKAVCSLPDEQRKVLMLRYWEQLTPDCIAQRLGLPVSRVRSIEKSAFTALLKGSFGCKLKTAYLDDITSHHYFTDSIQTTPR